MQSVLARTAALRAGGRITVGPCSRKNFRAFATNELTITTPDDMHLHVRDGPGLRSVVPHTAQVFRRAIIMPNLVPPITTTELAMSYKKRIMEGVPPGNAFEPLMVLYLTGIDDSHPSFFFPRHLGRYSYASLFRSSRRFFYFLLNVQTIPAQKKSTRPRKPVVSHLNYTPLELPPTVIAVSALLLLLLKV